MGSWDSGRHLQASGGHLEASGGIWRLLETSGTPQEASGSHLETFESHLGAIWESFGRHLGGISSQGRHKLDESMKNIEKQLVFLGFEMAHRADVAKT